MISFDEKKYIYNHGYTDIYTDTLDIKYQKQGKDSKYTNLQNQRTWLEETDI